MRAQSGNGNSPGEKSRGRKIGIIQIIKIAFFTLSISYLFLTSLFRYLGRFWQRDHLTFAGRIAPGEGRFNTNTEVVINTEVKSIPVTKKGVYFAFRDQGACISILAIKVYYISCPEVSVNFARFPATPTGREVTFIEQTVGTCVANADIIENPIFLCKGDGKWYLPTGGCHCKPGYQADVDKQECKECPIGKFKHEPGSHTCEPCPEHSKASDYGFTECRCDPTYYRAEKDPKNMPCTREC